MLGSNGILKQAGYQCLLPRSALHWQTLVLRSNPPTGSTQLLAPNRRRGDLLHERHGNKRAEAPVQIDILSFCRAFVQQGCLSMWMSRNDEAWQRDTVGSKVQANW